MDGNITYCNGKGCVLSSQCKRYQDGQRNKDKKTAQYRKDMERRLRQCRIMNGLEPGDD